MTVQIIIFEVVINMIGKWSKFSLGFFVLLNFSFSSNLAFGESEIKNNELPGILFVSGSHSNRQKTSIIKAGAIDYGFKVEIISAAEVKNIGNPQETFSNYSLIIFDGVSTRDNTNSFGEFLPILESSDKSFMAMKGEDKYLHNFSNENAKTISSYYDNGGKKNIDRLLSFLRYRILDGNEQQAILPPVIYPQKGIYHPDFNGLIFETRQEYFDWLQDKGHAITADKPTVGLLIQRASIEVMQTSVIDAAIERIEKSGAQAIPFFFELSPFASNYDQLIQQDGKTLVDAIINFRMIHWANKRKKEFEKFGVPVLQALTYFDGGQDEWEKDIQGISPGMTPFILVLPESSGVINPFTVSALKGGMSFGGGNDDTPEIEVIDYQIDHLVSRTLAMISLKYKTNSEKKIAVMVWGGEDMGASFLNVPDSLHTIAHRLNNEGYNIEPYEHDFYSDRAKAILEPFYRDDRLGENIDILLNDGLAELLPLDDYFKWFNKLPAQVTQPIMDYWGHPKDSFMSVEKDGEHYLLMPRIQNGNMVVLRQPPRADDKEQAERIYHDKTIPINHFYLAGYYYAREHWGSDAIIHLGTHGSQEYLYGKERVPSIYDHSNLAVWDTPILYPFIVDDVGEAMQSKRRGSATIISHMTPPFAASGLQGELADIHNLMHEYKALDEGGVKAKTAQMIIDTCYENNICDDMDLDRESIADDFGAFLAELHDYMNELSGMSQPLGLHSYGELARPELVISTLSQMLGTEFLEEVSKFESKFYNANTHDGSHQHGEHDKHNHDSKTQDHQHDNDSEHGFHETKSELKELAGFKTVRDYIVAIVDAENHQNIGHEHHHDNDTDHEHKHDAPVAFEKLNDKLQSWITTGREYYRDMLDIKELDNTVAFLRGEYIPVTTGGDPLRHPESLPTGYNLYGFDPSRVPTKAAYEQGTELVEQIILDYYNDNGRYPDKLAFSLWSIETMRQYGVLEAQALRAMGMRPVCSPDGRVVDSEIIPFSELKRPRVDIVLSSTGLYRDAFPNIMQYLAKAIEKIAALKEDNNNIWLNSQRIASELKAKGIEAEEAKYLSSIRIFSNAPGQHGSGVDDTTFASETWDDENVIADVFLNRMGYYYGSDNSRYGKKLENINLYAAQLSGTDIALHARSSNLYGMLSTDDPFEYFGALSLAVRSIDGASPTMMISNLRNPSKIKAETADRFLSKELRTRNFHPRWITEMMVEGYSGAVEMSSRIDNFWGWQVVDPDVVRPDQWQSFFEVYIEDKLELGLEEFFEKVNPNAQARMLERMLEAIRKDYWQASEATLQAIIERYIEIVEKFDHYVDNKKLREFTDLSAQGFGLDLKLPSPDLDTSTTAASEPIEGQKLEQQADTTESKVTWDKLLLLGLIVILLSTLIGAYRQTIKSN